jgi:hypothetical protein
LVAPFLPPRECFPVLARLPTPRLNACACGARLPLRQNCRRKALEARHLLAWPLLHLNPRPLARLALVPLPGRPCQALAPCRKRHRLRRVLPRLGQQWRPRFRPPRPPRRARLRQPCRAMKWCKQHARRRAVAWVVNPHKPDLPRRLRQTLKLWLRRNGLALRSICSPIM